MRRLLYAPNVRGVEQTDLFHTLFVIQEHISKTIYHPVLVK